MHIKGSNGVTPIDTSRPVAQDAKSGVPHKTAQGSESPDQVTLTPAAQRLLEAARESGGQAPLDRARVEALREAVADGRYEVDAARTADKLLRLERELAR